MAFVLKYKTGDVVLIVSSPPLIEPKLRNRLKASFENLVSPSQRLFKRFACPLRVLVVQKRSGTKASSAVSSAFPRLVDISGFVGVRAVLMAGLDGYRRLVG